MEGKKGWEVEEAREVRKEVGDGGEVMGEILGAGEEVVEIARDAGGLEGGDGALEEKLLKRLEVLTEAAFSPSVAAAVAPAGDAARLERAEKRIDRLEDRNEKLEDRADTLAVENRRLLEENMRLKEMNRELGAQLQFTGGVQTPAGHA